MPLGVAIGVAVVLLGLLVVAVRVGWGRALGPGVFILLAVAVAAMIAASLLLARGAAQGDRAALHDSHGQAARSSANR